MANLDIILQKFNDEKKRDIGWRIMEHEIVRVLLPKHTSSNKGFEKTLQALESMWEAYATLTLAR